MANTNIAMTNFINNQNLIKEIQQLKDYHDRQSKIIKDLGDTIQGLKQENKELKQENEKYKKLFDQ